MTTSTIDLYNTMKDAESALSLQNYRRAVEILVSIRQDVTEDSEYFTNYFILLGHAFYQSHQLLEAAQALHRVLQVDPSNIDGMTHLASVYNQFQQFDKSLDLLNGALASEPNNPTIHIGYASLFRLQRQYAKALDALAKASEFDAEGRYHNIIEILIGRTYYNMSNFEKSLLHYRKALNHNSNDPELWVNYGYTLIETQQMAEAKTAAHAALRPAPNFSDAYLLIGRIELHLHHYQPALKAFQKAADLSPQDPNAYVGMCQAAYRSLNIIQLIKNCVLLFRLESKKMADLPSIA